jgi:hypothetical protein
MVKETGPATSQRGSTPLDQQRVDASIGLSNYPVVDGEKPSVKLVTFVLVAEGPGLSGEALSDETNLSVSAVHDALDRLDELDVLGHQRSLVDARKRLYTFTEAHDLPERWPQ